MGEALYVLDPEKLMDSIATSATFQMHMRRGFRDDAKRETGSREATNARVRRNSHHLTE